MTKTTTVAAVAGPQFLRLTRSGNSIVAHRSSNGTMWSQIGSVSVSLKTTLQFGLAVASRSTTLATTATIDSVTVLKS